MAMTLDDAKIRVKIETDNADRTMDDLEKEIERVKKARGEESKERTTVDKDRKESKKEKEESLKEKIGGSIGRVGRVIAMAAGGVAVAGVVAEIVRDQLKDLGKKDPSGILNSIADNVIGKLQSEVLDPVMERIIAVETALPAIKETALVAGALPRIGAESISPATIKGLFDAAHAYRQQQAKIEFEVGKMDRVFEARAVMAALNGGFEALKAEVGL